MSEEFGKRIEEVREKVKKANENVTEEKKLGNRTNFALDYLYSFRDMGQLIQAVQDLGTYYILVNLLRVLCLANLPSCRYFNASLFRLLRSIDFRRDSLPPRPIGPHPAL